MYRNRKLLDLARDCPKCMLCGKHNDETIVAAHSNQLLDGRGKGIKSHDFRIAFLCFTCHNEVDIGKGSREEKRIAWEYAHRNSIGWLFESGHLEVK